MDGLLQQRETSNEEKKIIQRARKGRARFHVRSLGGKLVISAALTLVCCMLLFTGLSWWLVRSYYERQARNDANMHLADISQTYLAASQQQLSDLERVATSATVQD